MSTHPASTTSPAQAKLSLLALREKKRSGERIVMVTAYDFPSGRLADEAGVDTILVGDSAAMTVLGLDSTVPATLDDMIVLGRATVRGARRPIVVVDMPFGSYQVSDEDAVRNAIRLVKETGCDMVKVEGGTTTVSRVRAIVQAGIAVCAHIGLTPQSATLLGGYRAQGRSATEAVSILDQARALEAAGASLLVLECVPSPVSARITQQLTIPTIGIGAGPGCDGQVLVYHDLLGITEGHRPRFVKVYASAAETMRAGIAAYAAEVRSGAYPAPEHEYSMPDDELRLFEQAASGSAPQPA
ncbi:MAG: 3-methyl-2-oxobutanoate hydroxymethyltransferase [Thermoleophilia bacterium]